jgi:hypothetical protein
MLDDQVTDQWASCALDRAITHEEHVRIAVVLLRGHARDDAIATLVDDTRRNCEAMGVPERFDEHLTRRWGERIADAVDASDPETFEELIEHHPDLRRSDLLGLPEWKANPEASAEAESLAAIADWGRAEQWRDWQR